MKKALWVIEELGLKYERIDAGMQFGVVQTPEYKRMNPNSLVPTIDDDGFVLWESHAIVRYLAAKHGAGTLWPADLKQRADSDRWMDWAYTFQAQFRTVFWGLVRTPPEKRDMKAIEEARKKCARAARDSRTWRSRTGPTSPATASPSATSRSAATCSCGCACRSSAPRMPNLQRWFDRLCTRAAYRKIVDIPLS